LMRMAGGNRMAMRLLLERHRVRVYRWLLRMVGDADMAEDLTSEVFFAAWRHAGRFARPSTVGTWVLAIPPPKPPAAPRRPNGEELDETTAAQLPDCADSPEAIMREEQLAGQLRRALIALSGEHREVVDLVYYHGQSVGEVGQILDIPEATVKTRMLH